MRAPQPLNLSAQCLEAWSKLPRLPDPQMQRQVDLLTQALHAAPKFLLPAGGRPLDDPASVSRLYTDLRLPFPVVALEYLASGPVGEVEVGSSKRIALAWSLEQGSPDGWDDLLGAKLSPRRGLLVQSISYIDKHQFWMPIAGLVEVVLDEQPAKVVPTELDPFVQELTRHRWRSTKATETFTGVVRPVNDQFVSRYGAAAADIIGADAADEVLAILSFAALSMCGNVSSEVIPAPQRLNRKREANGKPPLFDTRVLMVEERGYAGQAGGHGGGNSMHASPRAHLRRGHIRRLEPGRNVWVNAAVVNAHRAPDAPNAPRYELRQRG